MAGLVGGGEGACLEMIRENSLFYSLSIDNIWVLLFIVQCSLKNVAFSSQDKNRQICKGEKALHKYG